MERLIEEKKFTLLNESVEKEKALDFGSIELVFYHIEKKPAFLDFISSGWEIDLITAIGKGNFAHILNYIIKILYFMLLIINFQHFS